MNDIRKRVLLVAPGFFGYVEDVSRAFEAFGVHADRVLDVPSEGILYKSVYKVFPGCMAPLIARHARRLEKVISEGSYNVVLFIGGMTFPFAKTQLDSMRAASPESRFAFYFWDSLSNSPRAAACLDCFDVIASFEEGVRPGSLHLPLFYTEEYDVTASISLDDAEHDACFVGSVHQPSKFRSVLTIVDALRSQGLDVVTRFYLPSRSSLAYLKTREPLYRRRDIDFIFESLSRQDVAALYARCACVIDSPQSGQTGLTMRTIEAVGAGRRLITANKSVKGYDFYSFGDVLCTPVGDGELALFARGRNRSTPDSVRRHYSLTAWAKRLLEEVGCL